MTDKAMPHPVDLRVGGNIKHIRKARGVSQEELALAIGKTFQQVQKYEKGANRVSASVLVMIARTLRCGIDQMFAGIDTNGNVTDLPATVTVPEAEIVLCALAGAKAVIVIPARHLPRDMVQVRAADFDAAQALVPLEAAE